MVEIALQSFRPNGLRMAPIKTSLDEHLAEDQVTNAGKMVVTTPRSLGNYVEVYIIKRLTPRGFLCGLR